jgi:hypothetical protein
MWDDQADRAIIGPGQCKRKVPSVVFGNQHTPEAVRQVNFCEHNGFLWGHGRHKV